MILSGNFALKLQCNHFHIYSLYLSNFILNGEQGKILD